MTNPLIPESERRLLKAYFEGFDRKPCRFKSPKYRKAWENGRSDGDALRRVYGDDLKPVPGLKDPSWDGMKT